jgi:hypothetical protein
MELQCNTSCLSPQLMRMQGLVLDYENEFYCNKSKDSVKNYFQNLFLKFNAKFYKCSGKHRFNRLCIYIYIYIYIFVNIILKSAATNAVGITMPNMGPLDCNFLEN